MATGYLLDTNVISETRKARAEQRRHRIPIGGGGGWAVFERADLGELRKGVAAKRRTDPGAADQLAAWVDGIGTTFTDRVLPIDAAARAAVG